MKIFDEFLEQLPITNEIKRDTCMIKKSIEMNHLRARNTKCEKKAKSKQFCLPILKAYIKKRVVKTLQLESL